VSIQAADRFFEFGEVMVHGALEDGVGGVEGAVREVVTHARDLPPGDVRLGQEQFIGQGLDGLADLQEPDADGVEDQPVGRSPRARWEWMASIAARMSVTRWWSR
jgi:hypothetical protein